MNRGHGGAQRFSWERFREVPIVAILRGIPTAQLVPVIEALRSGGLTTVEITMNSPGATEQIRLAAASGMNVGAGTVTRVSVLEEALRSGASFIVTPSLERSVVRDCVARGIPIFPGVLSPSEVATAMEWGAHMVKVFPADLFGAGHLRRLRDLFPEVRLLPTGGMDVESLAAFRRAGADGFGIGSPLLDRRRLEAGDWRWIEQRCGAMVEALRFADRAG